MTRQLDLTQRQVRALCEGAKKAGCVPVIQIGNMVVRLVPDIPASLAQPKKQIDDKGKGYL